jgi:hypothetical protein
LGDKRSRLSGSVVLFVKEINEKSCFRPENGSGLGKAEPFHPTPPGFSGQGPENESIRPCSFCPSARHRSERGGRTMKAKKSAKSQDVDTGYAGHMTARNQWIKLGLSPIEVAALRKIHRVLWTKPGQAKLAHSMLTLAVAALAHWPELEAYMKADCRYARSEGFPNMDQYRESLVRAKFNLKQTAVDHYE